MLRFERCWNDFLNVRNAWSFEKNFGLLINRQNHSNPDQTQKKDPTQKKTDHLKP